MTKSKSSRSCNKVSSYFPEEENDESTTSSENDDDVGAFFPATRPIMPFQQSLLGAESSRNIASYSTTTLTRMTPVINNPDMSSETSSMPHAGSHLLSLPMSAMYHQQISPNDRRVNVAENDTNFSSSRYYTPRTWDLHLNAPKSGMYQSHLSTQDMRTNNDGNFDSPFYYTPRPATARSPYMYSTPTATAPMFTSWATTTTPSLPTQHDSPQLSALQDLLGLSQATRSSASKTAAAAAYNVTSYRQEMTPTTIQSQFVPTSLQPFLRSEASGVTPLRVSATSSTMALSSNTDLKNDMQPRMSKIKNTDGSTCLAASTTLAVNGTIAMTPESVLPSIKVSPSNVEHFLRIAREQKQQSKRASDVSSSSQGGSTSPTKLMSIDLTTIVLEGESALTMSLLQPYEGEAVCDGVVSTQAQSNPTPYVLRCTNGPDRAPGDGSISQHPATMEPVTSDIMASLRVPMHVFIASSPTEQSESNSCFRAQYTALIQQWYQEQQMLTSQGTLAGVVSQERKLSFQDDIKRQDVITLIPCNSCAEAPPLSNFMPCMSLTVNVPENQMNCYKHDTPLDVRFIIRAEALFLPPLVPPTCLFPRSVTPPVTATGTTFSGHSAPFLHTFRLIPLTFHRDQSIQEASSTSSPKFSIRDADFHRGPGGDSCATVEPHKIFSTGWIAAEGCGDIVGIFVRLPPPSRSDDDNKSVAMDDLVSRNLFVYAACQRYMAMSTSSVTYLLMVIFVADDVSHMPSFLLYEVRAVKFSTHENGGLVNYFLCDCEASLSVQLMPSEPPHASKDDQGQDTSQKCDECSTNACLRYVTLTLRWNDSFTESSRKREIDALLQPTFGNNMWNMSGEGQSLLRDSDDQKTGENVDASTAMPVDINSKDDLIRQQQLQLDALSKRVEQLARMIQETQLQQVCKDPVDLGEDFGNPSGQVPSIDQAEKDDEIQSNCLSTESDDDSIQGTLLRAETVLSPSEKVCTPVFRNTANFVLARETAVSRTLKKSASGLTLGKSSSTRHGLEDEESDDDAALQMIEAKYLNRR